VTFADRSMEAISYLLLRHRVSSPVSGVATLLMTARCGVRGIFPLDSLDMLIEQRGEKYIEVNRDKTLDWDALKAKVAAGMRNSNVMAIAPTATIANITGVSQSIEPTYQNLYVKSNLSGEFTVVNPYLVNDLKSRDLWDKVMVNDLKYFDGSVQTIDRSRRT
jgi:ribonucleoside-diphosphate reductase alpha chain